ncbi:MAG: hypothetical protein HZC55_27560 [Verrucomicrobia bacterium]|nr:hypothetical protein [Verrucomicrobiota bacterium]
MDNWLKYCAFGARACASYACACVLWSLWLVLLATLGIQLYVASRHELAVPGFLLRRIEQRLAESGVRATFARTSFDPQGRILMEGVRVFLPSFPEPVLTARAVFLRLNPRMLIAGGLEAEELQVMSAALIAPAQFTPSGRPEELVGALDATLAPVDHELLVRQLTAQIGTLPLSITGRLPLRRSDGGQPGPAINEFLNRQFATVCRRALEFQAQLAHVERPFLDLYLATDDRGQVQLAAAANARLVRLPAPLAAEADFPVARTQLRLGPSVQPIHVAVTAAEIRRPPEGSARDIRADVSLELDAATFKVTPRSARLALSAVEVAGVEGRSVSAELQPGPLPRLAAQATLRLLDAPLSVAVEANFDSRTADLRFAGDISPRVLDVISRRVGTNVRRFYDFDTLEAKDGHARFGPDWKFSRLSARVRVPRMNSYGVVMEDGRAAVELEPGRFYSPEAFARVGENHAHGSYEHNLRTQEFRFLLTGRLRPLDIGRWFGPWWPNFFRQFEFPAAPPDASVDVQGVWRQGRQSRIFVFAETPHAIIRDTPLEALRTRLFIRPGWVDGLEAFAMRDGGEAEGTFAYRANSDLVWDSLDLDLSSSFDLSVASGLMGPAGAKSLAPFRAATAPTVRVRGTLHGPGAAPGAEDRLFIEARTMGEFRLHDFPVQDAAFTAQLQGHDVNVERFNAEFAGGKVSGNARVWGNGPGRRVGFNVSLDGINLGQAVTTLQGFLAQRRGAPPPPPDRFVQARANLHLNISASAEGAYDNPFSFRGDGNAYLQGAELGQVPLLGLLSELFTFTSLRFTEARGNFKIDGPKLAFPKIELRGANSAIDAHGDFALDRRELNFVAKVFPFSESGNVLKTVVGAVLTPLSNVLEVKLTGTFEKPHWAFVMGPTNLLRAIAEGGESPKAPATPEKPRPDAEAAKGRTDASPPPTPPARPENP